MSTLISYLLQTVTCSGILFCLYRLMYFNRQHHEWNRFFLLGTVIVSLTLPLVKVPVPVMVSEAGTGVINLLNVVTINNIETESVATQTESFDINLIPIAAYIVVSITFLLLLTKSLLRIFSLYKRNVKEKVQKVQLVMTEEKASPFSFFNIIFWNRQIDRHSSIGARIFKHEKTHVDHFHSIDRLVINFVLSIFWCNPFFWLIKKEMILVHEFIADKNAVNDNDPETFSKMLLMSAFPSSRFGVASHLFTSSIQRRLSMLTRLNKSKAGVVGKWMALPVMLVLLAGFNLREKEILNAPHAAFTVVIDAGHGGTANGTTAGDGTTEKDLNLMIAKKIKQLNTNDQLKIIMTRESDEDAPLRDRVEKASKLNVDAFISIHVNADPAGQSGMQVMMTKNATRYAEKSQILGSLLSQELKKIYTVDGELRKGPADRGVWVLDAPEINYPSILVECGNMRNEKDLEFVKLPVNQEKIAQHILRAIALFAQIKH